MRVFGKRNDGVTGRRTTARKRMLLPVAIKSFQQITLVDLLNLSPTGARLGGEELPAVDQSIVVRLGKIEAFGVVAWKRGNLCGVHFDDPLTNLQVHNLEHETYLAIRSRRAPWQQTAKRDWESGYLR